MSVGVTALVLLVYLTAGWWVFRTGRAYRHGEADLRRFLLAQMLLIALIGGVMLWAGAHAGK